MPRPKQCRIIEGPPRCEGFKPKGIPSRLVKKIILSIDEYESIRLADHLGLEHEEASKRIGISRSVFTRLVERARTKVANALVEGCELVIEGGEYHFETQCFRCNDCHYVMNVPMGEGQPEKCVQCGSTRIENLNEQYGLQGRCHRHGYGRQH